MDTQGAVCWGASSAWMQGVQGGKTPQQAAGDIIWSKPYTTVLLLKCGAKGKVLGKKKLFWESFCCDAATWREHNRLQP